MKTANQLKQVFAIIFSLFFLLTTQIIAVNQYQVEQLEKKLKKLDDKEKPPVLFQLAGIFKNEDSDKAIKYLEKALKISKKNNLRIYEAKAYETMGSIYFLAKDYRKSKNAYQDELKIKEEIGNKEDVALVLFNLGSVFMHWGKEGRASKFYEESLEIAKRHNMKELEFKLNNVLFDAYYEKKRYKKALKYFKNYIEKKDSAFLTSNRRQYTILTKKIKEKEEEIKVKDSTIIVIDSTLGHVEEERDTLKVETERKGKEIEKLNYEKAYQEKVIQNQKLQMYFLIVGVLLVVIIAIVLFRLYLFKKKANNMLKAKNEEILQQKEEIEAQRDHIEVQNKHITDSIVYAQRIQQAALPDEKIINEVGIDHFILFKPRDIVSGDFYWMKRVGENIIIVAADCTGHGVPGAFVSMLGMSFLNDIIPNKRFNLKASEILEKLRVKVKSSLKQTGRDSESKDGMDIALCVINQEEQVMQYAGAHNPLYYIRDGELNVVKATRNPIGIFFKEFPFENHKIELKEGDQFYIFSDGYVDQFGGENRKKFSSKRLKKLILDIYDKDMETQKNTLNETIEDWKRYAGEQIDDILIVGFKV